MTRSVARLIRRWDINAAAITLSLGIGVAVYVLTWTVVNVAVFRPYPGVTGQNELAQLWTSERGLDLLPSPGVLRSVLPVSNAASHMPVRMSVGLDGSAEIVSLAFVSGDYFETLGVALAAGRSLRQADVRAAVISYELWKARWQSSEAAIGALLTVRGVTAAVVGIAPPGFVGASRLDMPTSSHPGTRIWINAGILEFVPRQSIPSVGLANQSYFVRMDAGTDLSGLEARVKMMGTLPGIPRQQTKSPFGPDNYILPVRLNNPSDPRVQVLFAMSFLGPTIVLCLCCLNATNLVAIRWFRRLQELSLRLMLGASPRLIIGSCLVEAIALAACSWLVAAPLLFVGSRVLGSAVPFPLQWDWSVVVVAVCVTVVTGLGSAIGPASWALRAAGRGNLISQFQTAPATATKRLLLIGQVGLAVALLGTAAQFSATVKNLGQTTASLEASELAIASVDLTQIPPPDRADRVRELLQRLQGVPGVTSTAKSSHAIPWTLGDQPGLLFVRRATEAASAGRLRARSYVTNGFPTATGMKILSGRWFTSQEFLDAVPRVAILDSGLARGLFGSPAGTGTLTVAPNATSPSVDVEVVGTFEARHAQLGMAIYLPVPLSEENSVDIFNRFAEGANLDLATVRQRIRDVDPRLAIDSLGTLPELQSAAAGGVAGKRTVAMVGTLGLLAMVVAGIGVAATTSNIVAQRRREVGIRLALGGTPTSIVWMFAKDALRVGLIGGALGVFLAKMGEQIITDAWYGVAGLDVGSLTTIAITIALLVTATAIGPAVSGVNNAPIDALRTGSRND